MHYFKKWWVWAIILVIVAAGTLIGKSMYDKKKEADRQALIHMGDQLDAAWDKYEKGMQDIEADGALAEEYTDLMTMIVDGRVPEDEIDEAKAKACKMEKELMTIYPTVYKEPSSLCK
ncbi:hypothetical protein NYE70_11520 [Paenibacillus sp. FSL R5-0407]|uniref:hypothetical protein n=1 Tax=Paenibacillus sp. FSL R5-0407 TaxID=2975320 RepID=UPI0030F71BAE